MAIICSSVKVRIEPYSVTTVENRCMTDTHALMKNIVLYVIQKDIEQTQANIFRKHLSNARKLEKHDTQISLH